MSESIFRSSLLAVLVIIAILLAACLYELMVVSSEMPRLPYDFDTSIDRMDNNLNNLAHR